MSMEADLARFVEIGEGAVFRKTVTDADIALFSAVSGDFDPIHVDDASAAQTIFGRRIAHGLGVLALLSAAESEVSRRIVARGAPCKPVSLGYDGIRFLAPVFVGDSLVAHYAITAFDPQRLRSTGSCRVEKADGTLCLVGQHIMKWVS